MLSWVRWATVVGFALGGLFDGILLHQILQWHHLLSRVPGMDTIRAQVLWDGYFHALMYLVAVAGLWGLWTSREAGGDAGGRMTIGALLVGFGVWHLVDGVLSHWLLGIHRIRLDSSNPLLWDLGWVTAFGIVPFLAGWLALRHGRPIGGGSGGSTLTVLLVGLLTAGTAGWSLQPPPRQEFTTVVFAPGISAAEAMNAVVEAGARLAWSDRRMSVVVVEVGPEKRFSFYRKGALLVSGSGAPGCFNRIGITTCESAEVNCRRRDTRAPKQLREWPAASALRRDPDVSMADERRIGVPSGECLNAMPVRPRLRPLGETGLTG